MPGLRKKKKTVNHLFLSKNERETRSFDNKNYQFLNASKKINVANYSQKVNQNELVNFEALVESNDFRDADLFDFSNIKTATDLLFWKFGQTLFKDDIFKKKNSEYFLLNGCPNISIWSLHYLNKIFEKNLLSIPSIKLNERFSCCERISESLLVSLNYDPRNLIKHEKIFDQAKCVIINSDNFSPNLIEKISNSQAILPAENELNHFFKYGRLKNGKNKFLNLYECSESYAEFFISERNSIVLTFDACEEIEKNAKSILSRLLVVYAKNILPSSILVLGVGKDDDNINDKIRSALFEKLKSVKDEIKSDQDIYLTKKHYLKKNFC
ncbi:hypothetical protein BpHYR1_049182 [Brachionus plicatilis]|uniref:Uncharacterized protein n=1 Tax=Brachionus plicatilis TaxID=10195 RepID=A0A3M7S7N5_BRAPC|nr:hypothetical protein BpHYR1_049182 [Brachionus plicatilis]